MVIAPLESCSFEPQAIMIYCDPSQLRQLLMAAKWHSGKITGRAWIPAIPAARPWCRC